MTNSILFRAVTRAVPRIVLGVVLLATVSCSAKRTKDGKDAKDGQNVDRKGLTGDKLKDSFDGDRRFLAADITLLGVAYNTYRSDHMGKSPTQFKDLERYFETDQPDRLKKNVRENIDFVWNIKPAGQPGAKTRVIVYERNPDKDGNRVVMTSEEKLRFMDEAEFQAALKAAKE